MQKLVILACVNLSIALYGCGYVAEGWKEGNKLPNTIFRNIVYFKNTTPYCTAKVFSNLVKQPAHTKKRFNPVKSTFLLKRGGGEHFIEYNFNTNNFYRTKIEWHDRQGKYLNTEYIGHTTSTDTYRYHIDKHHMGELHINLSNRARKECWQQKNNRVNINIY